MTLIKSISGIRGIVGGVPGQGLTPVDVVKFATGYGAWIKARPGGAGHLSVVVGRDSRASGVAVRDLVVATLCSLGIDVTDLGEASTPTTGIAVKGKGASGGIVITASHNPAAWNALKLLNSRGEFLSEEDGREVLKLSGQRDCRYVSSGEMGRVTLDNSWNGRHISAVASYRHVDREAIAGRKFTVLVDCINSVGGTILPAMLREIGVAEVIEKNCVADGRFCRDPEPLPENITDVAAAVVSEGADLGLVVDPDVDRLAIISEDGTPFGEEYTLVAVADYMLGLQPGPAVSNISSSLSLRDVAVRHGCSYFSSAVGEVNVVEEMRRRNAVIGGEGNGGVILPDIHYGRDALTAAALFLTHLATAGISCSTLRRRYPSYAMVKRKVELAASIEHSALSEVLGREYIGASIDVRDGVRIDYGNSWVLARLSNTEPIIRVFSEAENHSEAVRLADEMVALVKKL